MFQSEWRDFSEVESLFEIDFKMESKYQSSIHRVLDHFLSEKVMVFDNFLAADMHK